MQLTDRVTVITGATAGIGAATARAFVGAGARVAIIGRNDERGHAIERQLREESHGAGDAFYVHADVAIAADVQAAVNAILARWGRIDILINNAAIMTHARILDLTDGAWDAVIAVNLRGAFLWSKYALPYMGSGGAIINVSSVHAVATDPGSAPYAASKGALESFTRALSIECFERGVRVNALRLGSVDTQMLRNNPNVRSGLEELSPRELANSSEVAQIMLFLASPSAAFINGAVVDADGGRLANLGGHPSA